MYNDPNRRHSTFRRSSEFCCRPTTKSTLLLIYQITSTCPLYSVCCEVSDPDKVIDRTGSLDQQTSRPASAATDLQTEAEAEAD